MAIQTPEFDEIKDQIVSDIESKTNQTVPAQEKTVFRVLAGAIAALLGHGLPPFEAACAGAWHHREAARGLGGGSLFAEELADGLTATR